MYGHVWSWLWYGYCNRARPHAPGGVDELEAGGVARSLLRAIGSIGRAAHMVTYGIRVAICADLWMPMKRLRMAGKVESVRALGPC